MRALGNPATQICWPLPLDSLRFDSHPDGYPEISLEGHFALHFYSLLSSRFSLLSGSLSYNLTPRLLSVMSSSNPNSDAESDAESEISMTHKRVLEEVFEEDETALELAAAEEARLRREADERIAALGVRDPMLGDAMVLLEKVELEKLNDHGKVSAELLVRTSLLTHDSDPNLAKPWKAPPPVVFSSEYWREWQSRVKIDKAHYDPNEKERRHREAERER